MSRDYDETNVDLDPALLPLTTPGAGSPPAVNIPQTGAISSLDGQPGPVILLATGAANKGLSVSKSSGANIITLSIAGVTTAVKESGGQVLDFGAVTDGEFLKRSGTTIISGVPPSGAPTTAQYVTLATDATLTGERVLTGTANEITITDNGAGGTVVLSLPTGINAAKIADGSVTSAEFQFINTLSSNAQTQIDGKQPLDSDLTTLAGLTATTDNFIQSKASAWASRTVAQVKVDLGLTGTNSGDQTITLTGDVTGSGTGTFAATIAAGVIVNADINGSAAIDATKIADGSVTSTEFQFINTLSSNAQTQIAAKAPIASPVFTGAVTVASDAWHLSSDAKQRLHFGGNSTTYIKSGATSGTHFEFRDSADGVYLQITGTASAAKIVAAANTVMTFHTDVGLGRTAAGMVEANDGTLGQFRDFKARDIFTTRNVGIGTATFGTSAAAVLALFNGTVPSTSPADTVQLFSVDLSAGNATLGIRTETAVVTESVTSDRTLSIKINGTTYKLCLKV